MNRELLSFLTAASLLWVAAANARTGPLFRTAGDSEIASGTVNAILQDRQGFLWIGTRTGLYRYDGYQVRAFKNDPASPHSLSDNNVIALYEATDGRLWVGTFGGDLSIYDPATEEFARIKIDPDHPQWGNRRAAFAINGDDADNIWVGTQDGLFVLEGDQQRFRRAWPKSEAERGPAAEVSSLVHDHDGRIWVGTRDGAVVINSNGDINTRYLHAEGSPGSPRKWVTRMTSGTGSSVWLGTAEHGLFHFDPIIGRVVPTIADTAQGRIAALLVDGTGRVWISYRNQGVAILDPATGRMQRYRRGRDPGDLPDDRIQTFYQDRSGVFWIGTFNAGLVSSDPLQSQFGKRSSPACLRGAAIYSLARDARSLWLGSDGGGMAQIDRADGSCRIFRRDEGKNTIPGDYVYALLLDDQHRLWVGTIGSGLAVLNRDGKTLTRFAGPNGSQRHLRIGSLEDAEGDGLWVGTLGKGLFRFDPHAKKPWVSFGTPGLQVYAMEQSPNGTLWLGTQNGIYALNSFSNTLHAALELDKNSAPIRAYGITSNSEFIWAATNRGLIRLDPVSGKSAQFRPDQQFYAIQEDAAHNIWVSGSHGLSRFDPSAGKFDDYDVDDGLQGNEFTSGVFRDPTSGEILFAGVNGLNAFFPASITKDMTPPQVVINDFFLFNKPVDRVTELGSRLLPKPINLLRKMTLTHEDYIASFEIAALNFANPARNEYAYRLDGFDPDWNYTTAKFRRATYTNLPPGHYMFRVKASNRHGIWNENGATLAITVLPPMWLTWWAKTAYALVILASMLTFLRHRTASIRRQNMQLTKLVHKRTEELATEKQVVERLLARKNEEFANVSHEFRTPLTLIIGPIRALLKTRLRDTTKAKLALVGRNAYRLLRMVDQLLDLEKLRVHQVSPHRCSQLDKTLGLLTASFDELAKVKNVDLELGTMDEAWVEFTSDALEKIIVNLLSNSIKYTAPGGQVMVTLRRCSDRRVSLVVKDTGLGIPKADQQAVFERFHRVRNESTEHVAGAGIGLALVKELVESHGGSIGLESEVGVGTTVTIELPEVDPPEQRPEVTVNEELVNMELESFRLSAADGVPAFVAEPQPIGTRDTLLVVEDDPDLRNFIIAVLNEQYQCLASANGREGIDVAVNEIPDLIITDIMMPEIDGFELSRTLKEDQRTSHIPIVMLTARGDRKSRMRGWKEYADEYLTKPFDEEELLLRVSNLLAIRKILRNRVGATLSECDSPSDVEILGLCPRDRAFVERLTQVFDENHSNSEFSMEEMAAGMAMSVRQLQRKTKGLMGHSPREFLRACRLRHAQHRLRAGDRPNEVAYSVGFTSPAYFARCFKAHFGMTASEYSELTPQN